MFAQQDGELVSADAQELQKQADPRWLCEQVYRGLLGRDPDDSGWNHVRDVLTGGGDTGLSVVLGQVLQSEEFRGRWARAFSQEAFLLPDGDDLLVADFSDPRVSWCLADGWHAAEPSWTWAAGAYSVVDLPPLPWHEGATLYLEVVAACAAAGGSRQRLFVSANGHVVGSFALSHDRPCSLVCDVPGGALLGKTGTVLTFHHPDAVVPASGDTDSADRRDLSFAFREIRLERLTSERRAFRAEIEAGLLRPLALAAAGSDADISAAHNLAGRFESLGSNCEFGFVQRELGHERPSLLRFAGLPLHKLLRGLRTSFDDLASPARLRLRDHRDEYLGFDDVYLLDYHTGRKAAESCLESLQQTEPSRLRFLARKLLEDIEDGEKVLVVKDDEGLSVTQVAALMQRVRARGTAVLLWVEQTTPGHAAGDVELVCPGLLRGWIERFADLNQGAHTIAHATWRTLLVNAMTLHEAARPRQLPG